jgi:holo-[acyl-carrier protein] synthase
MGVVNLKSGKPTLHLTGGAKLRLATLTPRGHLPLVHLTLTDEYPFAQAHVIIEAVENPPGIVEAPEIEPLRRNRM